MDPADLNWASNMDDDAAKQAYLEAEKNFGISFRLRQKLPPIYLVRRTVMEEAIQEAVAEGDTLSERKDKEKGMPEGDSLSGRKDINLKGILQYVAIAGFVVGAVGVVGGAGCLAIFGYRTALQMEAVLETAKGVLDSLKGFADGGGRLADGGGRSADGGGRSANAGGRVVDAGGRSADAGGRLADVGGRSVDGWVEHGCPMVTLKLLFGHRIALKMEGVLDSFKGFADAGGRLADAVGRSADAWVEHGCPMVTLKLF